MSKRLRATSLVEILIVLAIISSTILSSMLLVSNSFVVVRQNQTEDYVNGLVINAMEIVKSPSNVLVNDNSFAVSGATTPSFFKLSKSTGDTFYLEKINDQQMTSCVTGSRYLISPQNLTTVAPTGQSTISMPPVCLQVKILPVATVGGTNSIQGYFQLTIIAIYNLNNQPVTITFQSNRYETFKQL